MWDNIISRLSRSRDKGISTNYRLSSSLEKSWARFDGNIHGAVPLDRDADGHCQRICVQLLSLGNSINMSTVHWLTCKSRGISDYKTQYPVELVQIRHSQASIPCKELLFAVFMSLQTVSIFLNLGTTSENMNFTGLRCSCLKLRNIVLDYLLLCRFRRYLWQISKQSIHKILHIRSFWSFSNLDSFPPLTLGIGKGGR